MNGMVVELTSTGQRRLSSQAIMLSSCLSSNSLRSIVPLPGSISKQKRKIVVRARTQSQRNVVLSSVEVGRLGCSISSLEGFRV